MYTRHSRKWSQNRYVYPVISRRSQGLSIGINLNPDKVCNFGCVYCQVERSEPNAKPAPVDVTVVQQELAELLQQAVDGSLWEDALFADVPMEKRVLRDIAFSGDAEPTSSPNFLEVVKVAVKLKEQMQLETLKLVLITNATLLMRDQVVEALRILNAHNGEIWAKLDAGTPSYYQRINQAVIPFSQVLKNITRSGQKSPLVIQTMVANVNGSPFPQEQQQAYIQQIKNFIEQGCQIQRIQLYTVARSPSLSSQPENSPIQAVTTTHLKNFKSLIKSHLPNLKTDIF